MPRTRPNRPDHSLVVVSYAGLESFIRAFADGHLNLLLIVGGHGLQKSRLVRDVVGDGAFWVETRASAFGLYQQLFEHRDQSVVIDDVDGLFGEQRAVSLLK